MSLVIWSNQVLPEASAGTLKAALAEHTLIHRPGAGEPDPDLETADVAYGQPPVASLLRNTKLKLVQISSAGITAYDREDLEKHLKENGIPLAKSSVIFDEPCAEQVLSFMTFWARRLDMAFDAQRGDRPWLHTAIRPQCVLLRGQTAVLYGFGAIAKRLVELLTALGMEVLGVRRTPRGDESVDMAAIQDSKAASFLQRADHVINILPASPSTAGHFDSKRFAMLKPGAVFYNIGRGTTVDQEALLANLTSGHLSAALLDATDPEPLPPEHPLWDAPNCFITPHTAGGHRDEEDRLIGNFLENLRRLTAGESPIDRVY